MPVPDRDLGDVLVRREQVTERRPVRAVERATQVCQVDVLRGPEGLGQWRSQDSEVGYSHVRKKNPIYGSLGFKYTNL